MQRTLGRAPRPPERLLVTSGRICSAGKDEQKVGKPVQVHEHARADRVETGCGQRLTLCAPADRARNMQARGNLAPAWEHEALELRKLRVEHVAVTLERVDLLLRDAEARLVFQRNRKVGTQVEELVLDAAEHDPHVVGAVGGENESDGRIQLVHGSVGCDPRVELRDPGAVAERGLARVAPAGVDLGQPYRLVTIARHVRRLGRMNVRVARTGESDTIAEVFIASFRGLTFLPSIHTDDQIRTWICDQMIPSHDVWVAEDAGSVVGFAALSEDLLGHLYVRPEHQSRGIGTALLDVVKRERPNGFKFWVFQRNEGARRFYERHGCRLVELTDGSGNEEKEPDALYEWVP